jgi:molecular chaperone GrpE
MSSRQYKNQKKTKSELEKRLEEEMLRESHDTVVGDAVSSDDAADANHEAAEAAGAAVGTEFEALEAELLQTKDKLLRAHADFDNYRKRSARDYERLRKTAAEGLIRDLLPVLDHLDLALQHKDDTSGGFAEGVELVLRQFGAALQRHGVNPIPAVGEKFDPHVHEAVTEIADGTIAADRVAQEFQRGYMLGDQVLRPSKVAVSKGPAEMDPKSGDTND